MRHALLCMLALLLAALAPAQSMDQPAAGALFEKANAAYAAQDFQTAFDNYRALARGGWASREVLANAGNAAYRLGDAGQAVLYYRRSLEADPAYRLARANLERVQPATNVAADAGAGELLIDAFRRTNPWLWVGLAEAAFLWMLACVVLAAKAEPGSESRGAWFGRLAGAAVLVLLFIGAAGFHRVAARSDGDAVVIRDRVITRLGPGENFFEQLELPAGTVIESVGAPENGWLRFKLLDGRSGFLPVATVERI